MIIYKNGNGERDTYPITAGVPQGSVLGPVLWNLAYNEVLKGPRVEGCAVRCYADDTIIMAAGDEVSSVMTRAKMQVSRVLNTIRRLGLEIAPQKTDLICFPGRRRIDREISITIDGVDIQAKKRIKYLGVIFDSRMSFIPHIEYLENKVGKVSRAFQRIVPNLRGPGEKRRRLYAGVILSVALYAAPIWGEAACRSRRSRVRLNNLTRTILIRVIVGYRTVSLDTACVLARIPHMQFLVRMRGRVYLRIKDLKVGGGYSRKEEEIMRRKPSLL